MTDYSNIIGTVVGGSQVNAASGVTGSIEDNPDDAAKAFELAQASGVPPEQIYGNLDAFQRFHKAAMASAIVQQNPHLQDYVNSHPLAPKLSADDWGNLDTVSQSVKSVGDKSIFTRTMDKLRELDADEARRYQLAQKTIERGFGRGYGEGPIIGGWIKPEDRAALESTLIGKYVSYPLFALMGSPIEVPMRLFGGLVGAGSEVVKEIAKDQGMDEYQSEKLSAEVEQAANIAFMGLGSTGVHVPPELNAIAKQVQRTSKRVKPYVDANVEPPLGVDPAIDQIRAAQAKMDVDRLMQALAAAQKSNTRERNPQMFANFIRQHTNADISVSADAVRAIYGDTVPMPDDGLLGWVPGIEDQLMGSANVGGDIHIPLADWLAKVDPDVAKQLRDHTRVRAGGLTLDETKNLKPIDLDEDLLEPAYQKAEEPKSEIDEMRARLDEQPKATIKDETEGIVEGVRAAAGLKPIGPVTKLKKRSQGTGAFADVHDFDFVNEEGKAVGDIQLTYDPAKKDIYVEYVRHNEGPQAFGPRAIRDISRQLKEAFPEAKTISGVRVSGAREAAAEGRLPEVDPRTGVEIPWSGENVSVPLRQAGELIGGMAEKRESGTASIVPDNWIDLGAGTRIKLTDEAAAKQTEIYKAVDKVVQKLSPRLVDVAPVKAIEGKNVTGVYLRHTGSIPTILWVLGGKDPVGVVRHEIIHHLRRTGFLSRDEWSVLRDAAIKENWIKKYDINRRYPDAGLGVKLEESIASHFEHWNRRDFRGQLPTGTEKIFNRLKQLYEGVKAALRDVLGFEPTWKDVFGKIERGEVGERRGVEPIEPGAYRGPTYQKGEREVLYHGTSKDKPFKGLRSTRNGTWFTTDAAEASQYAVENDSMGFDTSGSKITRTNTASRVIPMHHNFEKTKVVTELPAELKNAENYRKAQSEYFDKLRAEGYDSFRIKQENGHSVVVSLDNSKLEPAYGKGSELKPLYQRDEQGELDVTRIEDKDLFAKANAVGMTVKSYRRYMELMAKQDKEDMDFAAKQNLKDIERRQTQEWKEAEARIRSEVRPNFENRPDLAADKFLREGILHGEKVKGRPRIDSTKLTPEQKAALDPDFHTPGGVHPDDMAGLFGYHSGQDLIDSLSMLEAARKQTGLTPRRYLNKLVADEVERRMRQEHGDLAENILSEAEDHVISQTQFDMLHEETLAAATRAGMEMSLTKEDMKVMAQQGFALLRAGAAKLEVFLRGAHKAGEAAERALLEGDAKEAFRQKQLQLFNLLYAKEAKALEKDRKRFDKLTDKYSSRQVSGTEAEYTNYIHQLMQRFGIAVKRTPRDLGDEINALGHGTLQEFVESKNSDYGAMWLDERLYDPKFDKPVDQMSVDEFRALHDALVTLNKAGMDEKKVIRAGEKEDLATVTGGMEGSLETFPHKDLPLYTGKIQKYSDMAKRFASVSIINAETWLNRWDRDNPLGWFNQWLVRPMYSAMYRERSLGREFSKDYHAVGEVEDGNRLVRSPLIDPLTITKSDEAGQPYTGFTRRHLAAMINNAGNEYNWNVLTQGHGADPGITKQTLINMTTKKDWERAERLGKVFGKAFEMAQTVYRGIYGVAPPKIELKPFTIQFPNGEVFTSEGWYYPIIRDADRTKLVRFKSGEELLEQDRGMFPSIANGYTKRRTGAIDVLSLESDMIVPRLNQIIHDIAFRSEVIEGAKIIKDQSLRNTLRQHYGPQYVGMLDNWISDIAGGANYQTGTMSLLARFSNYMRTNVISSLIAFAATTVMKHGPSALANSMFESGAKAFSREFTKTTAPILLDTVMHYFTGDPHSVSQDIRFAYENSELLQSRNPHWREVLGGAHKTVEGRSTLRDNIVEWGSKPVALSDAISAVPTWLAKYKEAILDNDHGTAVFMAERAVRRAHGDVSQVNLPEVIRRGGPFGSWLTSLYGFFGTQMQRRVEIAFHLNDAYKLGMDGEIKAAASKLKTAGALAAVTLVWVAVVEEYVDSIGADDHRSWLHKVLSASFSSLAASVPLLRDFRGVATGHQPSVGLASTLMTDIATAAGHITDPKKAFDRNHAAKTIQDLLTVTGEATGMMPRSVARATRYGINRLQGNERPRSWSDTGVGLMRGTSKRRIER